MTTLTRPRHVLALADLTATELHALPDLAARMKAAPFAWTDALRGRLLVTLFEGPSTATRASFAAAAERLGLGTLALRADELQIGRGETAADTGRVLSSYAAAVVVRIAEHRTVDELAAASRVPVVNAQSPVHHPCQALADLLTLREWHGRLEGLRVAWMGDGALSHSLLQAGALTGMDVVVACPPGYEPDPGVLAGAASLAELHGGSIRLTHDLADVRGADAYCTGVRALPGDEQEEERRRRDLRPFRVDRFVMERAARGACVLHGLPARRGEEVSAGVIDGPASAAWLQAANRLPTQQALLLALVTGDWSGERG